MAFLNLAGANESKLTTRAIHQMEVRSLVESVQVFAPVMTRIIAKARTILAPFTTVSAAKSYQANCTIPIGTATVGLDELKLDRYVGNAIEDCEDEMSYANFDLSANYRADLHASVLTKINANTASDLLASATVVAGTVDLSTNDKVNEFLITLRTDHEGTVVGLKQTIDGARIERCEFHGKPFLAVGKTAYIAIKKAISSFMLQSSATGLSDNFMMTPHGVAVVYIPQFAAKQMLYGVAGVPTMGFREDTIKVDMDRVTTKVNATAVDLDIAIGNPVLQKLWYISEYVNCKAYIFPQVQSYVKSQLAL